MDVVTDDICSLSVCLSVCLFLRRVLILIGDSATSFRATQRSVIWDLSK